MITETRYLTPLVITILGLPSFAASAAEYGDIIRETPEYEEITTPKTEADDDDDHDHDRHHRHHRDYDRHNDRRHRSPSSGNSRVSRGGSLFRVGTVYFGVTIGESEFDYDDVDNGDASIFRIGYRPDDGRLAYELSFLDTGDAEVTSLADIELQVETINLVITVNSSRRFPSRLNFFGQGGIYFADTTLSGPFDSVSEDSNGLLLAVGAEVMLNRNLGIRAEAYNLLDVEDFANDESISIVNVGVQFVF